MYLVTSEIEFCYGNRLLNYEGKFRFLHGHNGKAVLTFQSDVLDNRGTVLVFSDIKRVVQTWIDENLDHRMILNRADPVVPLLQEFGEPLYLVDANPTAENISELIFKITKGLGFPIVESRLWETPKCFATYRE